MKKKFLSLAVLVALTLVACEKQQPTPTTTEVNSFNTKVKNNPDQTKMSGEPMGDKKWFENNINGLEGIDYGCNDPGTDCITGTVITPSFATEIEDFANSGDQSVFADTHYSSLSTYIFDAHLDRVVNHQSKVTLVGRISKTSGGYLIFKDALDNVVMVYQFKL